MLAKLHSELACFKSWAEQKPPSVRILTLCEYGYLLEPLANTFQHPQKNIALTVMGLTHGNEVAGIAVLNEFLALVVQGLVRLPYTMAVVLGNPWASLQNKRFLERDLNRSFELNDSSTHEGKRARALEAVLDRTLYFLDLHQTSEPCETPFFIFPYAEPGYHFARAIDKRTPVVTHWGEPFSSEGMCSDEFVNKKGGIGITLEMGQNSFSPYHVAVGFRATMSAVATVERYLNKEAIEHPEGYEAEIYTWGEVLPYPKSGHGLDEGWYNFRKVYKGQRLGGSDQSPLLAGVDGRILFPKYLRNQEKPPAEICRILCRVEEKDLGKELS